MDIQMTLTKKGGVPIPSYFGLKTNLWNKLNVVLMQSRERNVVFRPVTLQATVLV